MNKAEKYHKVTQQLMASIFNFRIWRKIYEIDIIRLRYHIR